MSMMKHKDQNEKTKPVVIVKKTTLQYYKTVSIEHLMGLYTPKKLCQNIMPVSLGQLNTQFDVLFWASNITSLLEVKF